MDFDYFYGDQSEAFAFYRTPKLFYTDEKFRTLSSDAKILYGIMLDRLSLSVKNDWRDDDGRVYMMWGSFCGIYGIELSSDGLSIKENATKKLIAGYETNVWSGDQYEGAYLRKINGYYYLFLSLGTCCDGFNSTYHVRVARNL